MERYFMSLIFNLQKWVQDLPKQSTYSLHPERCRNERKRHRTITSLICEPPGNWITMVIWLNDLRFRYECVMSIVIILYLKHLKKLIEKNRFSIYRPSSIGVIKEYWLWSVCIIAQVIKINYLCLKFWNKVNLLYAIKSEILIQVKSR